MSVKTLSPIVSDMFPLLINLTTAIETYAPSFEATSKKHVLSLPTPHFATHRPIHTPTTLFASSTLPISNNTCTVPLTAE